MHYFEIIRMIVTIDISLYKLNAIHFHILSAHFKTISFYIIGTIVVIVIFGCLSLVGLFIYRDHRNRAEFNDPDRVDLVGNMQHQSPTRPYNLTSPPGELLRVRSM